MIFILSDTRPEEDGFYWVFTPSENWLNTTEPSKWTLVEIFDGTIWILGSDVPAHDNWVQNWKWGPQIYAPIMPSSSEGETT